MDLSQLVMSIVFENEEAFKNISKKQLGIICCTTKLASTNKNIIQSWNKYIAYDMYDSIVDKLWEAERVSMKSGYNHEYISISSSICSIMADIAEFCSYNSDVKDCLQRLVAAEHKEASYNIIYSYRDNDYRRFYSNQRDLFIDTIYDSIWFDIHNHIHDPSHYMFADKSYSFYDKIEKCGNSILEIWREEFEDDN